MSDIGRKALAIPLSAQVRIAAEMSPPHNRGLAAMMLEEWVPEAERLEEAVKALEWIERFTSDHGDARHYKDADQARSLIHRRASGALRDGR